MSRLCIVTSWTARTAVSKWREVEMHLALCTNLRCDNRLNDFSGHYKYYHIVYYIRVCVCVCVCVCVSPGKFPPREHSKIGTPCCSVANCGKILGAPHVLPKPTIDVRIVLKGNQRETKGKQPLLFSFETKPY